jgi:very-short-patch-repair endonuclease
MDATIDALAARQHGVFTRRQARAAGLSRATIARRVAQGAWTELNEHVFRLASSPSTQHAELMATVLSAGPDAVVTSSPALALDGVRGFDLGRIRVVTARRPARWALPGVEETFRLPDHHRRVVDGIPTATVARALFDFGAGCSPLRLRRATDAALAARRVTIEALERVVDDLGERGRHGTAEMRRVLAERQVAYRAPASELEAEFLDLVRLARLPAPDRQVDLGGRLEWIGRVDFVWRQQRIVVETDGGAFHDSVTDRDADERRDLALEDAGWTVLRFSWLDVTRRPTSVRRVLERALSTAA